MARGWESKAVEEQVEAASAASVPSAGAPQAAVKPETEEAERKHRRETLRLVRSRVSQQLGNARSVAQRQALHQQLRSIDADLEELGREA